MAGHPIDLIAITMFRDRRFKLEQLLALDLVEAFTTSPGLIGPLRQMARAALQEMIGTRDDWRSRARVIAASWDERFLGMWRRGGKYDQPRSAFQRLLNEPNLSVFDISDVIRLYGAVVEKREEVGLPVGVNSDGQRKDDYRKSMGGVSQAQIWKEPKKGGFRERGTPEKGNPYVSKNNPQLLGWQNPYFNPGEGAAQRGIDLKQASGQSTVKKIEQLFGLPAGADISGTTADSIYFVKRFCPIAGYQYDDLYQLVALASLVRARHHGLVEVALTLSANKIIEYHVGYYDTLRPLHSTHPNRSKVDAVFNKWNDHNWNNRILVYFDRTARVIGGWFFRDDRNYERLADVSANYSDFLRLSAPPLRGDVEQLMWEHGVEVT